MLIQNTHLKFKAYIAQTIEKFLYKKGTSSLSRRFKAQQPVILPTVSHDSQHELEKHFWMHLAVKKLQFEIKFMPIQTKQKKKRHDLENIYMHHHIVWSDWSAILHLKSHINLAIKNLRAYSLASHFQYHNR